jgi:hypothetical protein
VELEPVEEVDVGDGCGQREHGVCPHDLCRQHLAGAAAAVGGAVVPKILFFITCMPAT